MNVVQCIRSDREKTYAYMHKKSSTGRGGDYKMHTHREYEVFVFLKGSARFVIEGNSYQLRPFDILVIRSSELHRVYYETEQEYERIVLHIAEDFFTRHHCGYYCRVFEDRTAGEQNLISGDTVKQAGIPELLERMERYIRQTSRREDAAVQAGIVELLHLLNQTLRQRSILPQRNENIQEVIQYINDHIGQAITLDQIAKEFFISKYHLCRIFKESTGFTVGNYIMNKRLLKVRALCGQGMRISYACYEAGFGSYSNFYKAYVKATGAAPRKDLK
ncbi:AraC family transcriptional regulator [Ructibacterium gallinarum]|uniref:Helix-turn-helix transcriptional regulator n=1 Tax=Ructibacterium gallinarum TaxID=2779355 RepID=A0A9D5R7Y4_9FIRM|nr:AraC family transcriptional regulator [Ructibacterium gallinarum]MBE5039761.1 helix-turn-helix transcriptional regulator [Ructibacterium gallinarum]